eukprot:TRINITY_DN243_c0_g3_i1.p1 TRINITY_DN243_c0_g3~~TRINITY_DN243_c0_g3_i1.p1  ORF type:complete len:200 (+),score=70.04 TRINITY_DN243_c0_g3_i1:54-653(+)
MKALFAGLLLLLATSLVSAYPNEKLPHGNTTVIAIAQNAFNLHLFARGKDGILYHRYQDYKSGNWSDWLVRAVATNGTWDADPAVGVNQDGRIEVFIRYSENLDMWHFQQIDPTNPEQWTPAIESSCVDMAGCAHKHGPYWNTQPVFPTSDATVSLSPFDGRMQLFYRGFDGALYVTSQKVAGDPTSYSPPTRYDVIVE